MNEKSHPQNEKSAVKAENNKVIEDETLVEASEELSEEDLDAASGGRATQIAPDVEGKRTARDPSAYHFHL